MHNFHVFNILTTASSFNNNKLKEQNCDLESYNFTNPEVEAGIDIFYIVQLMFLCCLKTTLIYNYVADKAINRFLIPLVMLNPKTEIKSNEKITKKYNDYLLLTSKR